MKIPNISNINLSRNQLFTVFVSFLIVLGWLGLLLALLGIFYTPILVGYIFLGALALVYLISFNKQKIAVNHRFFIILMLSLVAVFFFSLYATPTIFSGRDQGALSEAAIRLSQNHHLRFSSDASKEFFKIYGPGPALNFPGFNYTQSGDLITQFPLGYISWLAIFYSIFGLNGFVVANSLTLLVFLFSFYLVARYYLKATPAVIAFLLIITSFIFSWFFKFTLSENLALMLTWFSIYEFVLFSHKKERFHLIVSLSAMTLLVFTRVEAVGFLAIIFLILILKYKDWKYLFFVIIGKKILLVLAGLAVFYMFNLAIDSQSYAAMLKSIFSPFIGLKHGLNESSNFIISTLYVLKTFLTYGLLPYLLLGLVGFVYLWRHKKFEIIAPFLILLPAFVYVLYPSISSDHPWMLRRFVFAVVPVCILYTIWFLDWFIKKRYLFYIFSGLLLLSNLIVFIPYLTFSPDKNLLPQIEDISSTFRDTDLVLVDRLATGSGWSMMTGPMDFLFGKKAVYFFNPKDLAKINTKKFTTVYLIIPNDSLPIYRKSGLLSRLLAVKDYTISTSDLAIADINKEDSLRAPIELPLKETVDTYGKIYLLRY